MLMEVHIMGRKRPTYTREHLRAVSAKEQQLFGVAVEIARQLPSEGFIDFAFAS